MSPGENRSLLGRLLLLFSLIRNGAATNAFWDCMMLNDDCLFFSGTDPTLIYFGFGIIVFYLLFLTVVLADLKFWRKIDKFQSQIDQLIVKVKLKMKKVLRRREQPSVKELASWQLKKSQNCQQVVSGLRYMVENNLPLHLTLPMPTTSMLNKWKDTALYSQPSKQPKPTYQF